jgi:CRISPR-associated protein Cmr2
MEAYLFLFTIGPVQSFISQARKVVDFQNGSRLLSDLIDKIIIEFNRFTENENTIYSNREIIYPSEDIKSKPNRFIAKLELKETNKEKIKVLGEHLIEYVRKGLKNNFDTIFNEIILKSRQGEINPEQMGRYESQVNNFLECYWVCLPIDNKEDYAIQYTELENWLGAVKNKRIINQIRKSGEAGAKCDLCGERNALLFNDQKKSFSSNYSTVIQELNSPLMNEKEGLCAICLMKRFYKTKNNNKNKKLMNSTAGIAIGHLIMNEKYQNEFQTYSQIFKDLFDEDYYFKDDFLQRSQEDPKLLALKPEVEKWFDRNEKLFRETIWSKYYAFILFDGDDMGKWISGGFLQKKSELEEFHEEMSQTLGQYTNQVKEIFNKYNGLLVYAGGDDICGFININQLWRLLKELRKAFPNLNILINEDKKKRSPSTASCGVCIAHYKEPLRRVIKTARSMEKKAKMLKNKDALSIAVLKASGNYLSTVTKWTLPKNSYYIPDLAEKIIKNLQTQTFSNKFIKNLVKEFWWYNQNNSNTQEDISKSKELIKVELKRLLYRSVLMNKAINEINEKDLMDENHLINKNILFPLKELLENTSFSNFTSFLHICEFFKSKYLNYEQVVKGG